MDWRPCTEGLLVHQAVTSNGNRDTLRRYEPSRLDFWLPFQNQIKNANSTFFWDFCFSSVQMEVCRTYRKPWTQLTWTAQTLLSTRVPLLGTRLRISGAHTSLFLAPSISGAALHRYSVLIARLLLRLVVKMIVSPTSNNDQRRSGKQALSLLKLLNLLAGVCLVYSQEFVQQLRIIARPIQVS